MEFGQFDWFRIAGVLVTAISVLWAIIQNRLRKELLRRSQTNGDELLQNCQAMLRHFEREDPERAYAMGCALFRQILHSRILLERDFSPETILEWGQRGRLASRWQREQAWGLLPTDASCFRVSKLLPRWLLRNRKSWTWRLFGRRESLTPRAVEQALENEPAAHKDAVPDDHPVARIAIKKYEIPSRGRSDSTGGSKA